MIAARGNLPISELITIARLIDKLESLHWPPQYVETIIVTRRLVFCTVSLEHVVPYVSAMSVANPLQVDIDLSMMTSRV